MNITELHKNLISIKETHKKIIDQAKSRHAELTAELSRHDLMLADAEHYLEFEKCDAVDMVRVAKIIKTIRQDRRKIKIELDQVNCLIQFDGTRDISKYEVRKDCVYKTEITNSIHQRNRRIDK